MSTHLPCLLPQFPPEERDEIIAAMRGEAKARGLPDTNDVCWRIFIQRVSPMGLHTNETHGWLCRSCIFSWGKKLGKWQAHRRLCPLVFPCQVVKNLHVCFTCSPVGEAFRIRSQRFLATINNTVVDWFHPWWGGHTAAARTLACSLALQHWSKHENATCAFKKKPSCPMHWQGHADLLLSLVASLIAGPRRRYTWWLPSSWPMCSLRAQRRSAVRR